MGPDTDVRFIKGVGESRTKLMAKLGLFTLRDLVTNFPRAYEDRTAVKTISGLVPGETVCVRAIAATEPRLSHIRQGLDLVKLRVVDERGAMDITFFNQPFVKNAIKAGETYIFYGKVTGTMRAPAMVTPLFEREAAFGTIMGRIMPIYSLTAGLNQRIMMGAVRQALDACADALPDALPAEIRERFRLCQARFAYENIHFPADAESLDIARRRLIFEELFVLAAALRLLRLGRGEKHGRSFLPTDFADFYAALPYELTGAQKRAISEAAGDMTSGRPMNRLVQGDVGSGKTAIAAACCWMTVKNGSQAAFMAPTEILATQHYRSLSNLLEPLGIRVGLLTGSMTAKQKRETHEKLALGEIDLIIGTHAIISGGVSFRDLALAITDEQHRFGVNQRSLLTAKGNSPHVLVMSATPIPRTLALIIYGDLDVSIIDELPPGRMEIDTFVVTERHRERIRSFIRKQVTEGRQVYIVCPAVDEGEVPDDGLKAARQYSQTLSDEVFPDLRVALVHGKLPAKEKDGVMTAFAAGDIDILVATTVIEVGVDVPNASLIIVENADRFGLSQLHQLRGRVGRGRHKSYCVLFEGAGGEVAAERLNVMRDTNDGFKISEEDLKLRGPGDFFGERQHGLPEMRIASLASDMNVLSAAQNAAIEVLRSDPELRKAENKGLADSIVRLLEINADKLN